MTPELDEEQRLIQESVRRFVETTVAPGAARADAEERLAREALAGLGELGVLGLCGDPASGGTSATAIALEEVARGDASLGAALVAHAVTVTPWAARAGLELAARLASGEVFAAFVERGVEAEGGVLRGRAEAVVGAAAAGVIAVAFEVDGAPAGALVEPGAPGLRITAESGRLGLRGAAVATVELDGVRVAPEARLPALDPAAVDRARVGLAAVAVGLARAATEAARSYALERRQFGRPIADFQAIQWMLADMATETDAARLLTRRAAWLADAGRPCEVEAAAAKLAATRAAVRAAHRAIQVHGGYGYTTDFPVERALRDAKALELGAGPIGVERLAVARGVLAARA